MSPPRSHPAKNHNPLTTLPLSPLIKLFCDHYRMKNHPHASLRVSKSVWRARSARYSLILGLVEADPEKYPSQSGSRLRSAKRQAEAAQQEITSMKVRCVEEETSAFASAFPYGTVTNVYVDYWNLEVTDQAATLVHEANPLSHRHD